MKNLEMLSKVMKRAWEIKREDSRNIFSLCLKIAWKEVKNAYMTMCEKLVAAGYKIKRAEFGNEIYFTLPNGDVKELPYNNNQVMVFPAVGIRTTAGEIRKDYFSNHEKYVYDFEKRRAENDKAREERKEAEKLMKGTNVFENVTVAHKPRYNDVITRKNVNYRVVDMVQDPDYNEYWICKCEIVK